MHDRASLPVIYAMSVNAGEGQIGALALVVAYIAWLASSQELSVPYEGIYREGFPAMIWKTIRRMGRRLSNVAALLRRMA